MLAGRLDLTSAAARFGLVSRIALAAFGVTTSCLWAGDGAAQEPVAGPSGVHPAAAKPPDPASADSQAKDAFGRARAADASIDRGIMATHADSIGAGKWSVNSYELLFVGLTYGVSDDTQVSVTTALPIFRDMPLIVLLQAKSVLWRSDRTAIALRGVFNHLSVAGAGSSASLNLFGAGMSLDHLASDAWTLHLSLDTQGVFGAAGNQGATLGDGALVYLIGGLTARAGDLVKFMAEFWLPGVIGKRNEFAPFSLLNYGIRFYGQRVSADLGFVKPLGELASDDLPLGFPWVTFNARF